MWKCLFLVLLNLNPHSFIQPEARAVSGTVRDNVNTEALTCEGEQDGKRSRRERSGALPSVGSVDPPAMGKSGGMFLCSAGK